MKTKTKVLGLLMAAVLLVTATIFGTMAYLTDSTDTVTNTFSVGKVDISLDEAEVTVEGVKKSDDRVTENNYKLMPGHSYLKDPTVHFAAGSEASYLFVKVENEITAIESSDIGYVKIADQIIAKGWTALDGVNDVYYKAVNANTGANAVDYPVFANFKISGDVVNATLDRYAGKTIKVTAYAVQQDGLGSAADAWNQTFGKTTE